MRGFVTAFLVTLGVVCGLAVSVGVPLYMMGRESHRQKMAQIDKSIAASKRYMTAANLPTWKDEALEMIAIAAEFPDTDAGRKAKAAAAFAQEKMQEEERTGVRVYRVGVSR